MAYAIAAVGLDGSLELIGRSDGEAYWVERMAQTVANSLKEDLMKDGKPLLIDFHVVKLTPHDKWLETRKGEG